MSAYSRRARFAAYQSVARHGGVADAHPHRLVVMLMDGALERLAQASGSLTHGVGLEKNRQNDLIHSSVSIIDEPRASLDLVGGGTIAESTWRSPQRLDHNRAA